MNLLDQCYYHGDYEDCYGFQYKITKIYNGGWVDLEAVNHKGVLESRHYEILWSVRVEHVKLIK